MEQVYCNSCGKKIRMEQGLKKEDTLDVVKEWGYFSKKDTERHRFCICEACYDRWISGFFIPPAVEDTTEIV